MSFSSVFLLFFKPKKTEKETDIIRNFLLKSSSVEAVKEQLSVLITTVHNQKNINENNLVIPIAELKKIVS